MPLSICSDSEEEERPRSAKTSVDLSASPWPNNIVNLEDVSVAERKRPKRGAFNWKNNHKKNLNYIFINKFQVSVSCVPRDKKALKVAANKIAKIYNSSRRRV